MADLDKAQRAGIALQCRAGKFIFLPAGPVMLSAGVVHRYLTILEVPGYHSRLLQNFYMRNHISGYMSPTGVISRTISGGQISFLGHTFMLMLL
jgi:hypothetical protein